MSDTAPNIFPTLTYRDAPGALAWLEAAFGFVPEMVHEGPDGTIAHAEMSHGAGRIMLGTAMPAGWGALAPPPGSGAAYVVVAELDAHCARARGAGARIVREPADTDYGSRDYAARDPEGNLWSFGTYRPGLDP
jgi:uncharacterized glyoxalase superfamily protein PhnB